MPSISTITRRSTKGELLVELDPRDYQVRWRKPRRNCSRPRPRSSRPRPSRHRPSQAQAQLVQQTAQFDIARINFNRNSSLYQQDLRAVAKQDVDTTQSTLDAAAATVEAARASVEAAGRQAAESQIGSAAGRRQCGRRPPSMTPPSSFPTRGSPPPESGRITRKTVEPGNYVTAGQTLFSIVRHDVWVTANFKETQLDQDAAGPARPRPRRCLPGPRFQGACR